MRAGRAGPQGRRLGPLPGLRVLPWLPWLALLAAVPSGAVRADCGDSLPASARQRIEQGGVQLVFAPRPWPIVVGSHFAVELVLCPSAGAQEPALRRVDADMPAHRHGMNYRASVQPLGGGRFVAEGLMFHMPGRWRFIFDVGGGAQAQRLTHELEVE